MAEKKQFIYFVTTVKENSKYCGSLIKLACIILAQFSVDVAI